MSVQDFHLTRFKEYRARGVSAYKSGEWKDARFNLLKASEHLFKLAKESEGAIRDQRIENAKKLKEMADRIDPNAPPPGSADGAGAGGRKAGGAAGKRAVPADGEDEPKRFKAVERPSLRFADIAGLEDVKEEIRLRLIYPFQHPEEAKRFGVQVGGGLLLYGPPGTGKTMIAKAIAGELDAAFFTVKPSEIMSKWVGESEQNIALLFKTARAEPVAIIFIDEIEALVPKRRDSGSTVMQRVVPQILAELEGFDSHAPGKGALLFVGATNEPWSLDPAIMRPGRFDEKVYIGLPDVAARRKMLDMYLAGRPLEPGTGSSTSTSTSTNAVDLDALAGRLEGYSGADIRNICRKVAADVFLEAIEKDRGALIGKDDIERVVAATRPSVKPQDLQKFTKFAEET